MTKSKTIVAALAALTLATTFTAIMPAGSWALSPGRCT